MTEQPNDEVPSITLAGQQYTVPEFAVFQLRKARRKIIDLNDALFVFGDGGEYDGKAYQNFEALSDESHADMLEVIYQGLLGGNPKFARDAFDALKIKDAEMLAAFIVIRRQCGIYVFKPKDEAGESAPGEAAAETASQTGTG